MSGEGAGKGGGGGQDEVVRFLKNPANWPRHPLDVQTVETHGALVFLAGDEVLKVKRAVRLPYLDFSTLAARRHFCEREIAVNRDGAGGIYRGVVPITREATGRLAIGGTGVPVEWAVQMRRFAESDLLSRIVLREGLAQGLAVVLADAIAGYHAAAPVVRVVQDGLDTVASEVVGALMRSGDARIVAAAEALGSLVEQQLAASADIRRARAAAGMVRRCHGDLHLNNIVLWQGRPVPFDAIEFDERLATIDTLYDLAFLLMDLERSHARAGANAVLARYLWRTGTDLDVSGLRALPLYLGLRAGVRAMVALDKAARSGISEAVIQHVEATLALANRCLDPPRPRLVAIGGLSGTGKTVLAAALAPGFGAVPGALHLRTDLERKRLAGVGELERLPPAAYTAFAAARVYDAVLARARLALQAGHSVVVDAVFARMTERAAVTALAAETGASFTGIWLDAPVDVLRQRVEARRADASDATAAVVDFQAQLDTGDITWARLQASGAREDVLARALGLLGD